MNNLKTLVKKRFSELKSFLETNKQVADLRHGYNGSLPPKFFLDFEKTLFGKMFKISGRAAFIISNFDYYI